MRLIFENIKKLFIEMAMSREDGATNLISAHNAIFEELKKDHLIISVGINEIVKYELSTVLYYCQPKTKLGQLGLTDGKIVENKLLAGNAFEYIESNYSQFKPLQNGLLVNMDLVEAYDSYKHHVYFCNGTSKEVSGMAIKNIVSRSEYGLKDLNKDISEYAPIRNRRQSLLNGIK